MSEHARTGTGTGGRGAPIRASASAETLRAALDAVGAVVDECRVAFDAAGIAVRAVDPAKVTAVVLDLDAEAFETYEADDRTVGIDVERLREVVGVADRDRTVSLALETGRLRASVGELEYTLAPLAPDTVRSPPESEVLDVDLPASVTLTGAEVDRFVRAADMVADHLAVGVDPDEEAFVVEAEGDTDDVAFTLGRDDLRAFSPAEARSLFSLGYLSAVAGPIPADREVRLELGTEKPMAIEYDIADGAGTVRYLLSPRLTTR